MVNESTEEIWLGDVEDRFNTALNAALLAHDYIEDLLNGLIRQPGMYEPCNTAVYAMSHTLEMVRQAHTAFHSYMAQELGKRENDLDARRVA